MYQQMFLTAEEKKKADKASSKDIAGVRQTPCLRML